MKKLMFVAVACAAGLTSFASNSVASSLSDGQSSTVSYLQEMFPTKKAETTEASASPDIDETTTASIARAKVSAGAGSQYSQIIARHAQQHGIPVALANAVVRIESNFRPNARGRAGEVGLMQIKPATARMMGYSGSAKGLYDPETNIRYGMKYLAMAHQLGGGDTCGTILRYNAGHAAKRMNKISAAYCAKVKRHMGGNI